MSFLYDLDLDTMTLILTRGLGMVKMYWFTKNEVSMEWVKNLQPEQTYTQTNMTENITYPHTRVVNIHVNQAYLIKNKNCTKEVRCCEISPIRELFVKVQNF